MTIEERIQELRKGKGLSQEQLAETLGVSRQAVSKWEGGQSLPEVEKLIAMSNLFEVTIDYILKGETPPSTAVNDNHRSAARLGSQIVSAVATMLLVVGIIATVGKASDGTYTMDIYGGLIIVSVGVMLMLIGWFLAGNRVINKPLFIINVLIAGVLPSIMVPKSLLDLKGEALKMSVESFYRTPGVFWLFTATYMVICGAIIYFTIIRKRSKSKIS